MPKAETAPAKSDVAPLAAAAVTNQQAQAMDPLLAAKLLPQLALTTVAGATAGAEAIAGDVLAEMKSIAAAIEAKMLATRTSLNKAKEIVSLLAAEYEALTHQHRQATGSLPTQK
jgi:hypothetical protein